MISIDVNPGINPMRPNAWEPLNGPRLGYGVNLKLYGRGFNANSEYIAYIRKVLDDNNIILLKKDGKCTLLTASLSTIMRRIKKDRNRPSLEEGLSFEEEQKKILADRHEKYQSSADFICDTTSRRPGETAHEIIANFKKQGWLK